MQLKILRVNLILLLFLVIGAVFRFYNLNWGSPFYFHPDERNIASSISQLSFPNQLNPHFFAYGSLPIYLAFFFELIINRIKTVPDNFILAIILLRIFSATLSLLTILLVFRIGRSIKNNFTGILSAAFATFSVGFIQFAHFGTFEMWLTYFGLLLFYVCSNLFKHYKKSTVIVSGIIFGLLVGIKVSSLVLGLIPVVIIFTKNFHHKINPKSIFRSLRDILVFLISSFVVYVVTNPFVFFDAHSFLDSMHYESGVAFGNILVFYTGEFFNSVPIIFQFSKIFPFLLNPFLTISFILCFLHILITGIRKKNFNYLLITAFFMILFFSEAFFFAKWTRYMVPTLPFVYLTIGLSIFDLIYWIKFNAIEKYLFIGAFLIASMVFSFSYFMTSFVEPDSRVSATLWAAKNIPQNSTIVSEVFDLGIVPFNPHFPNIKLFNFYDLDSNNVSQEELDRQIQTADYIILPSQRIIKTRLLNKEKFPIANKFYTKLFYEDGFKKIYETPCNIWCRIIYIGDPIYSFEETANVFDRPTVFIYKKSS